MRTAEAFPSKYLKKEDIGDARITVTIDRVELEDVGQGEDQKQAPVVYFQGKDKGMVLNKGNAEAITEAARGDDEMDNWPGVRIVLYVDRNVMFGGKRVGGIRVAIPAGKAPHKVAQTVPAAEQYDEANPPPADDDGLPF